MISKDLRKWTSRAQDVIDALDRFSAPGPYSRP